MGIILFKAFCGKMAFDHFPNCCVYSLTAYDAFLSPLIDSFNHAVLSVPTKPNNENPICWKNGKKKKKRKKALTKSTIGSEQANSAIIEGWYGEGGGRGFRIGNTCTPVADSC